MAEKRSRGGAASKPAVPAERPAERTAARPAQRRSASPRKPAQARAKAAPARHAWLSPQRQREFFALMLFGVGALLLVLLISSANQDAGALGKILADGMRSAFGVGALIVPLLFVVVGGLILWQERYIDTPISRGNFVGVLGLALLVLAMLETKNINALLVRDPSDGRGGGVLGVLINRGLVTAFGVAGTWTLLLLLAVLAILLTFNVTLRQALGGLRHGLAHVGHVLFGAGHAASDDLKAEPVPYAAELKRQRIPKLKLGGSTVPPPPALPTPAQAQALQEKLIFTPIAERQTQASLFEGRRAAPDPRVSEAETQRITLPKPAPPAKPAPKAAPAPPADDVAEIDAAGPRQAWPLPTVALFDDFIENEVDDNEKRSKARTIEDTLASFKIEVQVVGMNPGPAVTQYLVQPATGVKVSRIMSLERDLALALAAPSIRIEAPIPGTSHVGIEIPNSMIASVSMKEVIDTDEFRGHHGRLRLALGKDVSGTPVVTDLTKAPHLLIAGSTGSGKSVAVNSIVATLLQQNTPEQLKFIMIDPKMVELIVYNHIPHLLAPVVTELERVVSLLKWAVREMERRYKLLAQKGFRNIDSYNKEARKRPDLEPLPYIVVIIDELADLMMLAPDEVETLICRLAQMARAIGIHLILATQRPSVDVVTGLIKANFPTRMAFAVTSQIDSAGDLGHHRRRAAAGPRRHAVPRLRCAQADPRARHLCLRRGG